MSKKVEEEYYKKYASLDKVDDDFIIQGGGSCSSETDQDSEETIYGIKMVSD